MSANLKLLIVDDESYIRTLLKYIIDWESLGITVCGEASCAEEGLQLLDELQPNIIFSDICMDFMDGIEFCQIAKKRSPYIRMVLLSGHNEFEYAKRGIEAGVSAYLLKPLEEDKIKETIEKLKKEIYDEQKMQQDFTSIKEYLDKSRNFLIENNLNSLLLPGSDYPNALKRLSYLNVDFSAAFFQVVLFTLNPIAPDSSLNPFVMSMDCQSIMENTLADIPNLYIFFDLNHHNTLLSNNPEFDLLSYLETLKISILEKMDVNLTIGVGQPVKTIPAISHSYNSAVDATKYRTILGDNQIIQYNYMPVQTLNSNFSLEESISFLLKEIKSENLETSIKLIDECIDSQITAQNPDLVPVRISLVTIVNHLTNLLIQCNMRHSDSFSYCLLAQEKIYRLETVDGMKNLTHNLTASIIRDISSLNQNKTNDIMESIKSYLETDYSNKDLTLSMTAQKFYLNSSYLSRLFKQSTGTTFTKYLTSLRLNKAGELLLSTSLRAYEIGENVGFNDSKYFSSCFHKYYGMTTNEYRLAHS